MLKQIQAQLYSVFFFSDSIITLDKKTINKKFTLDKNQKVNVQITFQVYIENFFHTLFCSCCVALICVLEQMYYSTERIQEP